MSDVFNGRKPTSQAPKPQGVSNMNPSQCTQPDQLFSACMHAGGWPKLGWETQDMQDIEEQDMTCYDEVPA
jgi:hypothetical protein